MDQSEAPLLAALAAISRRPPIGFGAPGHHRGQAMPTGTAALLGRRVFAADVLTPKGLDDRTESAHALQRAHELAADAWGADLCRFATGGSTQSLHVALAAVARPGDTVILAGNAHKAEFSAALFAGLTPVVASVTVDADRDVEHGVPEAALVAALDAHPTARAVVVVSPTYFGVTSNIARLASIAHARGVPLIVDAAWGGAFGFSPRLPANPLSLGADVMVCSLHKTMGALAQGSALFARGRLVDQQRLALAYELFETTSPSVPILATLDATRRDHALDGERLWGGILDRAERTRRAIAAIPGLELLDRDRLDGDGAFDLDRSKVLIDVGRLGVAGYALDDWLYAEHGISVALSDLRHLLVTFSLGITAADARALVAALTDMVARLGADPAMLPRAPMGLPSIGALSIDMAMAAPDAFFADVELVRYEDSAGRIAAEIVAPAPPGVPRLFPGQRITPAHVAWLTGNRDAGVFILDPADPSERRVRVVA